jgi:hypothetical protein
VKQRTSMADGVLHRTGLEEVPNHPVHRITKNLFRITLPSYSVTLVLVATLIAIFGLCFFRGYFDPNFIAGYRAAAPISTVLGFVKGINPFQEEHVEVYGNGYSVLWPAINYAVARFLALTDYEQIKLLMYILNAVIVIGTAAIAFYVAVSNKLSALFALTISFSYLLVNSANISMGELSYSAGLSCTFFALVIVSNRFTKLAFCVALGLITLASLFKAYFALLAIVILFNCATFVRVRVVISIVCVWSIITGCVFLALTRAFPFYFDSIYFLQKMYQGWDVANIVLNFQWFLARFGFIFIIGFLRLLEYPGLTPQEKRRQKFYAAGSAVVCVYVFYVMLPHWAAPGTYLLHIVAPIVLAYAISRGARFSQQYYRRAGQIAALAMCIVVFIDPTFQSSPLQHWKKYGVLWRDELDSNQRVFMEADEVIRNCAEKVIYVDPMLARLALKRDLSYVDNGYRRYFAEYINARRNETLEPFPLLGWLAAPKPEGPERESPSKVLERADVVICIYRCPDRRTHQFVRGLGVLNSASNESMVANLYRKREN